MMHFHLDHYPPWGKLAEGVKTANNPGAPCSFEKIHGMRVWDYFDIHPERSANFSQAMKNIDALGMHIRELVYFRAYRP